MVDSVAGSSARAQYPVLRATSAIRFHTVNVEGIDVDMAVSLAQSLGVRLKIVKTS
jgi:ABC-type amino acid transport substrate-binding protein